MDASLPHLRTDTPDEHLFLEQVLASLPELWDWSIESQRRVVVGGVSYRFDFTITDGPHRVAVEIDGENKGPNAPSFDDRTRRQTLLTADGWEVLHFTNRQVRHEQEHCRRQIAVAVARLRERHRHRDGDRSGSGHLGQFDRTAAEPAPRTVRARDSDPSRSRVIGGLIAVAAVLLGAAIFIGLQLGREEGGVAPTTLKSGYVTCPDSHPIKGNIAEDGERIFHTPSGAFYDDTFPERCFANAAEAVASEYRASQR